MRFVKSYCNKHWIGVVLETYKQLNGIHYYVCLVVKTQSGKVPHKRIVKCYDSGWFRDHESFDISHINPDWFKKPYPSFVE